jgi:tetratricopeptide (TPR) repeat protein
MKKFLVLILLFLFFKAAFAQTSPDYTRIDIMLIKGDYPKVIDTCKNILSTDSLNAEIYYKLGLAYQNLIPDENSIACFQKASELDPENNLYRYMTAKSYFTKEKKHLARPIFEELCSRDTLNWSYSYYLTSIYLEEGKYDNCIKIYNRFLRNDSTNYIVLDKLGYAFLRKNKVETSIDYFNKSLQLNDKNINAIKNLSYLYPYVNKMDTAITLLNRAITLDPEDMDLYARRATIYFAKHYGKKTLDDYLKILASGDTTFLYLKRAGISYFLNMQPKEAIPYLSMASRRDTTDYETLDYLARCYKKLNDPVKTRYYYNRIIDVLEPLAYQLGVANVMLGEEYKKVKMYDQALTSYNRSMELMHDFNVILMIANTYDQELNNVPKAISFYKQFLNGYKTSGFYFTSEHIDGIKKRLEYLEEQQKIKAAQVQK